MLQEQLGILGALKGQFAAFMLTDFMLSEFHCTYVEECQLLTQHAERTEDGVNPPWYAGYIHWCESSHLQET